MVSERIRRLDDRGWTLAELLVVIAVILILSAISIPLFITYLQSSTVRAGAQEMRTALNRAKQLAITLRQPICVQPAGTKSYRFLQPTCAGAVMLPVNFPAIGQGADGTGTFWLQNNVTVAAVAPATFTPLGGATAAGQYTVTGPSGNALVINVSAAGRIQ